MKCILLDTSIYRKMSDEKVYVILPIGQLSCGNIKFRSVDNNLHFVF
ncbi:hypothetical protein KQI42_01880 [Tissierella sp. MSJ-40]|uniref:Uncharacterized protein n=1 Tax=Tissierella simiarum TaxID=2841534 RepID=A0ABS6E1L0_9FIRM|nr:hypothetical protein [Tissierella simiarum]MBU5436736.1 hypothetical protein [Tissierella simiarum]